MDNIKEEILEKLKDTQIKYNVKIPIAIESGSRGWGFASKDSDYDCRFIYVHEKDWYLSVLDKKDFIEYAVDEVFDINGWDLKKALKHIMKSNAVMLEWLMSNEVYIKNECINNKLLEVAKEHFNPISVSYHYLNMAKKKIDDIKAEDESKLKNYFYILRPIACILFIDKYKQVPFMEYRKNLEKIEVEDNVLLEINRLLEIKSDVCESYKIPKNKLLIDYFDTIVEQTEERLKNSKFEKNRDYDSVDIVFKEIIEMVWENE